MIRWTSARTAGLLAFIVGVALLYAPTTGHIDYTDSFLYIALVRDLVARHSWLDPQYLDAPFREHLPFGLWPLVVVSRLAGERAMDWLDVLYSAGALLLVWRTAARLSGEAAGVTAALALGACQSFFFYGGRVLLDPALLFWSTAAMTVILASPLTGRWWMLAGLCTAIAVLVKGPFGGVPLCAAAVARALADRSFRPAVVGTVTGILAALPALAFLIWDRSRGHLGWWDGYVHNQLVRSALGERPDGSTAWLYPFHEIVSRFWPGLPFVLLAFTGGARLLPRRERTERERALLLVAICAAIATLLLTGPQRKFWNHTLVAFPALALAAGAGGGPWLERLFVWRWFRSATLGLFGAVTAFLVIASASGWLGSRLLPGPCIFSRELRPVLASHAGERVLVVVTPKMGWLTAGQLMVELQLRPQLSPTLPLHDLSDVRLAVVQAPLMPADIGDWHPVGAADVWTVLER